MIVTGWGKQPGTQTGRTPCHRVVHFAAGPEPALLGSVTRVQVETALPHSLLGRRPAGSGRLLKSVLDLPRCPRPE